MQLCMSLKSKGLSVGSIKGKLLVLAFASMAGGYSDKTGNFWVWKSSRATPRRMVLATICGKLCHLQFFRHWCIVVTLCSDAYEASFFHEAAIFFGISDQWDCGWFMPCQIWLCPSFGGALYCWHPVWRLHISTPRWITLERYVGHIRSLCWSHNCAQLCIQPQIFRY